MVFKLLSPEVRGTSEAEGVCQKLMANGQWPCLSTSLKCVTLPLGPFLALIKSGINFMVGIAYICLRKLF